MGFYSGWFFIKKENALLTHYKTKLLLRQKNPVKTTFLTLCNLKYINDSWAILDATMTKRLLAISCFLEFYSSLPKDTKTGASIKSGYFF